MTVVARAPGRVNLIGEHTDYNGGFVLPVAVESAVTVTATARPDAVLRLRSGKLDGTAVVPGAADPSRVEPRWARYPAAVVTALRRSGLPPVGFEAEIASDLPPGGGLASSAALCAATALAAVAVAGAGPEAVRDRRALARLCRDAEAAATGVRCGLMDPYCALLAEEDAALLLDCRAETHEAVPIDPDRIALVIVDSGARRELEAGEYNRRREECERAVALLDGVGSLRDLSPADLPGRIAGLPDPLPARVRHVVTENARTLAAAAALAAGDAVRFGRLLDESHASLRDDYDVSGPELEAAVAAARRVPGCTGARLTGGGFGGFVVAAAEPGAADRLIEALSDRFPARVVVPSGGAWAARPGRKDE